MAEAFFVAGHAGNACVQANAVTASSADPLFGTASLLTGRPWEPFRFGALDTDPWIVFDCNIVRNPSFELDSAGATPPGYWRTATGGGTPTVSTTQANEGTKSTALDTALEAMFQDVLVRPGGTYRWTWSMYGDGGANAINAYGRDLVTGKYLLTDGSWTLTKTAIASRTAASWGANDEIFTFEAPLTGHVGPGRFRMQFERPGAVTGAAYVDSVYLYPKITVGAILFDTSPSAMPVTVQSGTNGSSFTTRGTLPTWRYRRFITFAGPASPERYWRFQWTGTLFDLYRSFVGQTLLGERYVMTRNPNRDFEKIQAMPLGGTETMPVPLSEADRTALLLKWSSSYSQLTATIENMLAACRYGAEPVFIVPRDDRATMVYGRGKSMGGIKTVEVAEGIWTFEVQAYDDNYAATTL